MTAPAPAVPHAVAPTIAEIRAAAARIEGLVRRTPSWNWRTERVAALLAPGTDVALKLELFQHGGSFKPRGALTVMSSLTPDALARGVTAVSAGNHAIATAFAARALGTSAKVVIMRSASPVRLAMCRALGAEVVIAGDAHAAFAMVKEIEADEGRTLVHPFEGPLTALGTATLGLEFAEQAEADGGTLDALIVPIGGGGLCAGMAAAVKQHNPSCLVFGVEPEGADTMYRSFREGTPQKLDAVRTIADSLGAPFALPYSFSLCRQYVDAIVLVDDDAICRAMALLYADMKLAPEPAAAAATAALLGPLRERLAGKRVGAIVCGANIDIAKFGEYVARGQTAPA